MARRQSQWCTSGSTDWKKSDADSGVRSLKLVQNRNCTGSVDWEKNTHFSNKLKTTVLSCLLSLAFQNNNNKTLATNFFFQQTAFFTKTITITITKTMCTSNNNKNNSQSIYFAEQFQLAYLKQMISDRERVLSPPSSCSRASSSLIQEQQPVLSQSSFSSSSSSLNASPLSQYDFPTNADLQQLALLVAICVSSAAAASATRATGATSTNPPPLPPVDTHPAIFTHFMHTFMCFMLSCVRLVREERVVERRIGEGIIIGAGEGVIGKKHGEEKQQQQEEQEKQNKGDNNWSCTAKADNDDCWILLHGDKKDYSKLYSKLYYCY